MRNGFFVISIITLFFLICLSHKIFAWQQQADYKITVSLNDEDRILTGREVITYYNNSPFALNKLYFHLYQNAFQFFRMGYASAMAWILCVIMAFILYALFKTSRWVYYEKQ